MTGCRISKVKFRNGSEIINLKKPECPTSKDVMGVLTDALEAARRDEITSVSISMIGDNFTYTTFAITPKATFGETMGTIEILQDKIRKRYWESQ